MAHWGTYIGFGFNEQESENLLMELRSSLLQYENKIAWHNAKYMHMTLQFLGWIQNDDVNKIRKILDTEKLENINFKLNGNIVLVGFSKGSGRIAIRVEQTKELEQYRERLGFRLQEVGVDFKQQDFLSHISLGRVHNLDKIEPKKYFKPRTIKASGIYLYESIPENGILVKSRSNMF